MMLPRDCSFYDCIVSFEHFGFLFLVFIPLPVVCLFRPLPASVRQIKLAIRQLLGARRPKCSVSYPWAPIHLQHCGNDDTSRTDA